MSRAWQSRMRVAPLAAAPILVLLGLLCLPSGALGARRASRHLIRPLPASDYATQRTCGTPAPGRAACMAVRLVPQTAAARARRSPLGRPVSVPVSEGRACTGGSPAAEGCYGLTPQDIHGAYNLPTTPAPGSPQQTIALVDAYNDPNAEADLAVYDEEFGLPACTAANGCFTQVNEEGNASSLPRQAGWSGEISLDIEVAHATCESCHIVLVEASASDLADLIEAETTAAGVLKADEISNSWGGTEPAEGASGVQEALEAFQHPGTVITASSGDAGYLNWSSSRSSERGLVSFPASSPAVVAVGGTRLSLGAGGAWQGETVWNGAYVGSEGLGAAGSGCSEHFSAPAWQADLANWASVGCGDYRAVADVAADADPYTGVAVYDSAVEEGRRSPGWQTIGGTSLSSPLVAATFALAGGADGAAYPASTLYENETAHPGSLHDVATGSNGECSKESKAGASGCTATEAARSCSGEAICLAGPGYDGPTGLGTPDGLAAFEPPGTPASHTQLITFTSTPPKKAIIGGATYKVTAIASSGLPVALSDLTPTVCSLTGSTVSFLSEGTCTIKATQAGDEEYEAAEAQQSFSVTPPIPQQITFTSSAPANATIGGATYEVRATASSGLKVSFASKTESICKVSGSTADGSTLSGLTISVATVSFLAAGECIVEATQEGNEEYLPAAPAEQSFQVGRDSQTINFTTSPPSSARVHGLSYQVWAVASSWLRPSFSTTTPLVCSLEGENTIVFVGGGTCTIVAAQTGDANYTPAPEVEQSFQVAKAPQVVSFTSAPPAPATVGGTGIVSASVSSGLAASFLSESPSVCAVEGSTVRLLGAGTCTIDASQEGDAAYEAALQAKQSFNVEATGQVLPSPLPPTPLPTLPSPSGEESPSTSKPAAGFALLRLSVKRKSGAIRLTASFTAPGRFTWLLRFKHMATASGATKDAPGASKGRRRVRRALFGRGSVAIAKARTVTVTIRPSTAALHELESLPRRGKGLHVQALLRFLPAGGGSSVERRRSVMVRLRAQLNG